MGAVLTATLAAPAYAQEDHGHDHGDPATRNLVSRSLGDQPDALALDPTTEAQVAANSATVADTRSSALRHG